MATITLDQFEALLDEAGERAAAIVGYPSPLFVSQATLQLERLITERNITEVLDDSHQDHDQAVH